MLEEYLLSLIVQGVDPRGLFIKSKDVLTEYKFELPSIGKIFAEILLLTDKNDQFDVKYLSSNLTNELLPAFDKCFLAPLPKFEDGTKYEEEVIKVSKDLRVIRLKERIKEISKNLAENEKSDQEIESLREEIATITSQIVSSQV